MNECLGHVRLAGRWTVQLAILLLAAAICAVGCMPRDGELALSGNLETHDLDLNAPYTSELLAIRVEEGQTVAPGDTIAILDTVRVAAALQGALAAEREASARLHDLEAGSDKEKIRAAAVQVEIARANLAQSERDFARVDSMHAEKLIDTQTYERAELARDNAASALKTAREQLADLERGGRTNQIAAAQAVSERTAAETVLRRRDYELAFLISNHHGVVQILPFQTGEIIPAGRAVATIRNPADLWAMVYVPEDRLGEVTIGDTIQFQVDAYPERTFSSTIVHIAADAEFTPRNVQSPDERLNLVFAVKMAVQPGQDGLRAGMPADFLFR